jgi:AcrR family transcriptional regulator
VQAVPTPERGYAKGRARRSEIIEQAMAMFGEVGYRGATLREIATRCGISHTGLLHHFANKEALLVAVLEHRDEVDRERLSAEGSGVDTLRRMVDLVAFNATRRGIVELFTVLSSEATSADHPAHDWFVQRYRSSLRATTRSFRRAQDEGALRAGVEPTVAAVQLTALMDGLQVQWLLDDGVTDMVAAVRAHLQAQLTVEL